MWAQDRVFDLESIELEVMRVKQTEGSIAHRRQRQEAW